MVTLIAGFIVGRTTSPVPPTPLAVTREADFQRCMALVRADLPNLARRSRTAKLPRATFVYGAMSGEFDCANISGIGGLNNDELTQASGYHFQGAYGDHPFDQ
jgi:hypothetical protein